MTEYVDASAISGYLRSAEGRPVHVMHYDRVGDAAIRFRDAFDGNVLYAVKCNTHPKVLRELMECGITRFDVASREEIDLVKHVAATCFATVELHYHNPAKSRADIAYAYRRGVRHFVIDHEAEIWKISQTVQAVIDEPRIAAGLPANCPTSQSLTGIVLTIRACPHDLLEYSLYPLSDKFGCKLQDVKGLAATIDSMGGKHALYFHVGSQCWDVKAYSSSIEQVWELAQDVGSEYINIGGGMPAPYNDNQDLSTEYFLNRLSRVVLGLRARYPHTPIPVFCEPGRAMVSAATTVLTQVVLSKTDERRVYLNDGIFGSMMEVQYGKHHQRLPYRIYVPGDDGEYHELPLRQCGIEYTVYGPTCDGNDVLPYTIYLPDGGLPGGAVIAFALLGAYGASMATRFNGFGNIHYTDA